MQSTHQVERFDQLLDYIHRHIREPLTLEALATQSAWSRWQLQRVFVAHTGCSVAQYVRELKLSQAAEWLLDSNDRVLDIALSFGFGSEVSFSRAFKQFFRVSPHQYRKRGVRRGIRTPMQRPRHTLPYQPLTRLFHVRLEHKPAFTFSGLPSQLCGLLSQQPDFQDRIPAAWQHFERITHRQWRADQPRIGLIDTLTAAERGKLVYWTGIEQAKPAQAASLQTLTLPESHYAVLPFQGPVQDFQKAVTWLIADWLPTSGNRYLPTHYEFERYLPMKATPAHICAEYWLPVSR